MKQIRWFTLIIVALSLSLGVAGCLKSKQVRYASMVPDFPVSPIVQDTQGSAEPAQGTVVYQYYPSVNVYYDSQRNVYFYSDGEDWHEEATLPAGLRIDVHETVTLELPTNKPYLAQEAFTNNVSYMKKSVNP